MPTLDEIIRVRLAKLEELEKRGINPFPNNFRPTATLETIRNKWNRASHEDLTNKQVNVAVAGRIMSARIMGKASFFHIKDSTDNMQAYIRVNEVGQHTYELFKKYSDIGDIVGVKGQLMKTRTGELTILVKQYKLLAKALRPLPEKYHGLQDQELRFRKRYLDLLVNEEVKNLFIIRSKTVKFIRDFLDQRGFIEVETPMMQPIPGGAAAKPFVTHHNALNLDLYLRIAPELYLKRLLVGGFEKVYEINRNFRNEGISAKHNPEFTMLELYWAYADFEILMEFTRKLLTELALFIHGRPAIPYEDGWLTLEGKWPCITLTDSLVEIGDIPKTLVQEPQYLRQWLRQREVQVPSDWGLGKLQTEVYERAVEPKLEKPTFITHHPVETSPLSRRNEKNPNVVDRFELVVLGKEIANAFSELNDPRDQRGRFEKQLEARMRGDEEAQPIDEDFIEALEYGMPPAAGEGVGIDRLVMLLTGKKNIREVILFPTLRPYKPDRSQNQ